MLRTIIIEGSVGEAVGREWRLDVASANEAMRAIDCLTNGKLMRILLGYVESGLGYLVHLGGRTLESKDEYFGPTNAQTIRFEPVIGGAGDNDKSWGQVVVGVVLIIVGAWAKEPNLVMLGVSLVLGGAAQLLTPTPTYKEVESERSTAIGGVVNTIRQGLPVPLGYGEMIIGSQMISLGATNVDTDAFSTDPSASQADLDAYQDWLDADNTGTYSEWYILTH